MEMKQHTPETCPGRPCSRDCDHVEFVKSVVNSSVALELVSSFNRSLDQKERSSFLNFFVGVLSNHVPLDIWAHALVVAEKLTTEAHSVDKN